MNIPEGLPGHCYAVHIVDNRVIKLYRGQAGYSHASYGSHRDAMAAQEVADAMNAEIGVSKAQVEAMIAGSMFGWHVPAANPARYDENGRFVKGAL
jgi:hypothetical protein